jgi:hypothetical protein
MTDSNTPYIDPFELSESVEAKKLSVQSRAREPREQGIQIVSWMARSGSNIPPWWSPARDKTLRDFWKKSDHLSGAVYTMQSRMSAIPLSIVPIDMSSRANVRVAEELTEKLRYGAEFGEGWEIFYGKWVEDLVTCDNGAFAEIIGPGRPDGPILGMPMSIAHLDSLRCQRTGDPEFPVIYNDIDGKRYKLHYTRVMYASQMPSPIQEMNGVGFSSVSRCINVSQTLIDILTFKQEKLGSRPHRAILIPRGGLDTNDIVSAFNMAGAEMDSMGLNRYSKLVTVGTSTLPDADVKVVELSSMPDGFDEETSIMLGMATIALAFGLDARELFPALASSSTRADALISHMKQRGKGPGLILALTEHLINTKFIPPFCRTTFDYQDDAQDRMLAEIGKIRAERRREDIGATTITVRVARQQMLKAGDIDKFQFEQMELEDGRIHDGVSVVNLFFEESPDYRKYLDLGVEDPLDAPANDAEMLVQTIKEKKIAARRDMINAPSEEQRYVAYACLQALIFLQRHYTEKPDQYYDESMGEGEEEDTNIEYPSNRRLRRENMLAPTSAEVNQEGRENLDLGNEE